MRSMRRDWLVAWSTFVGISWFALGVVFADDVCSTVCLALSDLPIILFFPAAIVWSLGLIVLYLVGRLRGRGSSSARRATTGTH